MRAKISVFIAMVLSITMCGCSVREGDNDVDNMELQGNSTGIVNPDNSEVSETEDTQSVLEDYSTADGHIMNSKIIFAENTEAVQPYIDAAELRKEQIRNSPTTIVKADEFLPGETYSGTAYYFSSVNGNDNNDGLSPNAAFQTTSKYNQIRDSLQPGDAIFFERGSLFRLEDTDEYGGSGITVMNGVTYSAYGEGAKPVLTKAIENSAYQDAWELYYEGTDGAKIWKYHREVQYCAGIVFDDTSYAIYVMEWPTPKGWMSVNMDLKDPAHGDVGAYPATNTTLTTTGEYLTVEDTLTEDLSFLTRLDLSGMEYPIDFNPGSIEGAWEVYGKPYMSYNGDLYLRCDAGNPGTIYKDIEIIAAAPDNDISIFDAWDAGGYVIDNLCIKYCYMPIGGTCRGEGVVIQNCEMGWQGNNLFKISSEELTTDYSLIGDGIYNISNNALIQNNYLYQMAEGVTFEQSEGSMEAMGNYRVTGNLIEYCGEGIRISWEEEAVFDKIELTDNMILYCGYGHNNNDFEGFFSIELGYIDCQYAKEFLVRDNVLVGSKFALFSINDYLDAEITDNVLVQGEEDSLMLKFVGYDAKWVMMNELN